MMPRSVIFLSFEKLKWQIFTLLEKAIFFGASNRKININFKWQHSYPQRNIKTEWNNQPLSSLILFQSEIQTPGQNNFKEIEKHNFQLPGHPESPKDLIFYNRTCFFFISLSCSSFFRTIFLDRGTRVSQSHLFLPEVLSTVNTIAILYFSRISSLFKPFSLLWYYFFSTLV